jgi:uncharacterized membrane protein YjjP (DUF1212 family)
MSSADIYLDRVSHRFDAKRVCFITFCSDPLVFASILVLFKEGIICGAICYLVSGSDPFLYS